MRIVRIVGSLCLGFLALGGSVQLPTVFESYGDSSAYGIAAIIDVGLPVALAVGAYKLWPRRSEFNLDEETRYAIPGN